MESSHRPLSAKSQSSVQGNPQLEQEERPQAGPSRLKPAAKLTLMKYLQDLPDADTPPTDVPPRYHTGRLPNSKAGDGKPRLLLMGQRR
jgi:Ras-related GTP-binding protein C/D